MPVLVSKFDPSRPDVARILYWGWRDRNHQVVDECWLEMVSWSHQIRNGFLYWLWNSESHFSYFMLFLILISVAFPWSRMATASATPQIRGLVSIGGHDGMHTTIKLRLHNLAGRMCQKESYKTEGQSFETACWVQHIHRCHVI